MTQEQDSLKSTTESPKTRSTGTGAAAASGKAPKKSGPRSRKALENEPASLAPASAGAAERNAPPEAGVSTAPAKKTNTARKKTASDPEQALKTGEDAGQGAGKKRTARRAAGNETATSKAGTVNSAGSGMEDSAPEAPAAETRPGAEKRQPGSRQGAQRAGRPRKGGRPRQPGLGADAPTVLFQPEAFADIYPSAAEALSILPPLHGQPSLADLPDPEDDGPQPALPGQPSLALPAAEISEDELAALDEQINGNRIETPERPDRQKRQSGRDQAKTRRGNKTRQEQPRSPHMAAAPEAIETADAPGAPDKADKTALQGKRGKAPREQSAAKEKDAKQDKTARRILYVSEIPDEQVEVVITDNGQVTEYFVEMAHQAKIRGNIYKGVINNVDTNLQAAFVNFGGGKNGFLQIDEVHPEYYLIPHDQNRGPKYPPIQKALKNGQEVLVQVVKEPSGSKGAFLTTWISLAGRFLVLTPGQEQIGVSRKVEDQQERARLKELLAGIQPGEDLGVIIRTASEGASKTSIQKDLQYLKRLWKDLRKRATTEKSPCLIYQEADLASRAVRDYLAEDIHEIWVDSPQTLESIRETTALLFPKRTDMVKLHQDPRMTLWERFNLQRQLEEVTSREVALPSGGRLVFDQTEALMAIDINSGKTQGKSGFEDMVFRTNMEAAEAIARHLRLRDIGGQVVIDFIEMRDRGHCRDVEKTMRNAMKLDRARHDVGRMSSFGLLELVRQRTGTSAISISSEPCPHCRGTGVRRNMEWQALHALRDLQAKLAKAAQAEQNNKNKGKGNGHISPTFLYETDWELGLYLLNKKRDRLSDLETKFGMHIELTPK